MRVHAALILVLAGAPAAAGAQIVGREPVGPVARPDPFLGNGLAPGPGIGRELRRARERIDEARESGRITRAEARKMYREARLIGRLARRYGHGGLSASERAELERRTRILAGAAANRP